MRKPTTAVSTALIAAIAATTIAFNAQAVPVTWKFSGYGIRIDQYLIYDETTELQDVTSKYHFFLFTLPANDNFESEREYIKTTLINEMKQGTIMNSSADFIFDRTLNVDPPINQPQYTSGWEVDLDNPENVEIVGILILAELFNGDYAYMFWDTEFNYYIDPIVFDIYHPHMEEGGGSFSDGQGAGAHFAYGIIKPIPEPATGLLVLGGAAVVLLRRRRRT